MERSTFLVHVAYGALASIIFLGPGLGCRTPVDTNPNFTVNQEKDIPVPRNFQFDTDKSSNYNLYSDPKNVGYFRSSILYYYGDQEVGNLVPWYIDQMKLDGWNFKDTRDELDKKRLSFTKGSESAVIWLYREYDGRFDRFQTYVRADIHPTPPEEMAVEEIINPPAQDWASEGAEIPEKDVSAEPASFKKGEEEEGDPESGLGGKSKGRKANRPSDGEDRVNAPGASPNKQVVNEDVEEENTEGASSGDESPDDGEGSGN